MAEPFLARQLHSRYLQIMNHGYLAGADNIGELERLAWQCHDQCSGSRRLVCFALASVFRLVSEDQEDRPVLTSDDLEPVWVALNQRILHCLEFLIGRRCGVTISRLTGTFTFRLVYISYRHSSWLAGASSYSAFETRPPLLEYPSMA
jgi:hypothetical protein